MSRTASIANRSFLVSRIMMSARDALRLIPWAWVPGSAVSPRCPVWTSGSDAGRAEAACLPPAGIAERRDNAEFRPRDPGEDELRDAVAGRDGNPLHLVIGTRRIAVPRRYQAGPLVIGVDDPDRVAEHQPVAVPLTRARQHQRAPLRIADAESDPSRDQHRRRLRPQHQRLV